MQNPFLEQFNTPFETTPFDKIKPEHFLPALEESIKEARAEIETIKNQDEEPTFENVIEKLEYSGQRMNRVAETFFNLNNAETNEEIQKIAHDFSPKISSFANDIALDPDLFAKVKAVYDQKGNLPLSTEQERLLEKTYQSFTRNGANLNEEDKERIRAIDQELSQLSLQFGENLLAATNDYALIVEDENRLQGLPEHLIEQARKEAKERGKEGAFAFTLQMPTYRPFVTYAEDRALREEISKAYGSRAFKGDDNDNSEPIRKITELRHERAQILGFSNHAEYVLQRRMAETPQKVHSFLDEILDYAKPAAERELQELSEFARERDGIQQLQKWDSAFYQEKLKQARFEIDDEQLKPYFELDKVIQGAFKVAEKLYGFQFVERQDIPKYHPDVKTYEVRTAAGEHQAVFYADFFPRAGKRSGAWMTEFRGQMVYNGENVRPHVSIVCNFTKPAKNRPSLLTFDEVLTLFHEFGHSLHCMMGNTTYPGLSGTNVLWDFVELPSQIMENWCYEKETLDLFAEHYETGEKIPAELVERLRESATFMEGMATVRQVSLSRLDMSYHDGRVTKIKDVGQHEIDAMEETRLLPLVPGNNMSTTFHHIFQGGYSAGYYSYKWAEVLDADAYELFKEKGVFNPEVADKFQTLLASGDSVHPSELYRRFRGKDPDPKALLRRAGLLQ